MRVLTCSAMILVAMNALAAGPTPEQLQALKKQQVEFASVKAQLVTAINDANTRCAKIVDEVSKGGCEQTIDPKVVYLRSKSQAAAIASLAGDTQVALKKAADQKSALASACSEQSKQSQILVKDLDSRSAEIESITDQISRDAAQLSVLAGRLKSSVDALQAALPKVQTMFDGTSNTIIVAEGSAQTVLRNVSSMVAASKSASISGIDASEIRKAVEDIQKSCEEEAKRKASQAAESKEAVETARDRKKAALDNLQKFLDIVRSMNPNI